MAQGDRRPITTLPSFYKSTEEEAGKVACGLMVAHFDRLTGSGMFAGFAVMALGMTAQRFGVGVQDVRRAVIAARNAEAEAARA